VQPSDPITSSLTLRLFGPFDARVNGAPLARLRTHKGEWLLALLALRAGGHVERGWLADTLWPESIHRHALYNLRRTLTDLRCALGESATRLSCPTSQTLCLDLPAPAVDVLAFDAAIVDGSRSALERAVRLYRGPLLEGCAEPWAFQERQIRERGFLDALECLAAAAQARGDAAPGEQYLRRALSVDPLRESACRALMALLAESGRSAAATELYRDLRLLLHRELNAAPDPETTALYERLRGDNRRAASARLAPPGRAVLPSLASSLGLRESQRRSNLPSILTRFVGREKERAVVREILDQGRLVMLTGAGGCGKTRLALEIARDLVPLYPEGVWLVELASLKEPAQVPEAIAAALELREEPGSSLAITLTAFLRDRRLLLVIDNCEHLVEACASLIESLLHACPELRVLATSREALRIPGEVLFRVPSLSLPAATCSLTDQKPDPVTALSQSDAACLFIDRALSIQPEFQITEQTANAIVEISRRLDGIPLAIELAAARLKALSLEEIAARLDDRFRLLTQGCRTVLPRHQTLRAALDWSYDLLSEPECVLLQQLSVFAGGFTLEAAEAVGSGEILDLLTALVEKSLVQSGAPGGTARYWMLETVRQYAVERGGETGHATDARRRHRDYFESLAETARDALSGPEQARWLARLDIEHDNLRSALAACQSDPEGAEAGLRVASALWRFWFIRGHWTEARQRYAAALEHPDAAACSSRRADALLQAGGFALRQYDLATARRLLEESLALGRALGDRWTVAAALGMLGEFPNEEMTRRARALQEESLALWRELGHEGAIAYRLCGLARLCYIAGDMEMGRGLYRESLALRQQRGDLWGVSTTLFHLAHLARHQGDFEEARVRLEQSLQVSVELGDRPGQQERLLNLGDIAIHRGDLVAAQAYHEQALAIQRDLGDRLRTSWSLKSLGHVAREQRDFATARRSHEAYLQLVREMGREREIVHALLYLAHLAAAEGRAAAWAHCEQALCLAREISSRGLMGFSLVAFAAVAGALGQWERAARLLGAGYSLQQKRGLYYWLEWINYDLQVKTARATLGESAFEAAWAWGSARTLEDLEREGSLAMTGDARR
jgi:predicted ATPase/DNA-binding SARP family transcriptional activator